ncbi:MAG: hypothetical protein ACC726_15070 [Chloroflexota bacterium]
MLARRLAWWKEPDAALPDQRRFPAQAMTDGDLIDMKAQAPLRPVARAVDRAPVAGTRGSSVLPEDVR